jgi:hypothetical protein
MFCLNFVGSTIIHAITPPEPEPEPELEYYYDLGVRGMVAFYNQVDGSNSEIGDMILASLSIGACGIGCPDFCYTHEAYLTEMPRFTAVDFMTRVSVTSTEIHCVLSGRMFDMEFLWISGKAIVTVPGEEPKECCLWFYYEEYDSGAIDIGIETQDPNTMEWCYDAANCDISRNCSDVYGEINVSCNESTECDEFSPPSSDECGQCLDMWYWFLIWCIGPIPY